MSPMSLLHHLFESFCPNESALVTSDGDLLFVKSQEAINCATLGVAAQTVMKYLPLRIGDVAIVNDPYSGGSTLNECTFVTKLFENSGYAVWWAYRNKFQDKLLVAKTVEEEGIRIPPTPIFQNGNINQVIMSALSAHPACSTEFVNWITENSQWVSQKVKSFQSFLATSRTPFNKQAFKDYLNDSKNIARDKITEAASGDAKFEIYLDNGEIIKMQMEISDGQVRLDFTGTSISKTHLLTESAAYGVCFATIAKFYGFEQFANTGGFSVLQITKPQGCLLNAKYPAPLNTGVQTVQSALKTLVGMGLNHVHTKKAQGICAHNDIQIELALPNQSSMTFALLGGAGQSLVNQNTEEHGIHFAFGKSLCEKFSLNKIEEQFPVLVQQCDFRKSENELSHKGAGLSFKIQALADVEVQWRTDLCSDKNRFTKNMIQTHKAEISHFGPNSAQKKMSSIGKFSLKAGESIMFQTANGFQIGK